MLGERLTQLVSFESLKLAAGALLLSPNVPMLFMGEEYGEESPFLYFISHTDQDLVESVRQGRKREFADFHLAEEFVDPFSVDTFNQSQLKWEKRNEGKHKALLELHRYLIELRRTVEALKHLDKQNLEASAIEEHKLVLLHRWSNESQVFCIMNFNDKDVTFKATVPKGNWQKTLDSSEQKWLGSGSSMPEKLMLGDEVTICPKSFALYQI
jgi:maltooligosyltrehalose trehalohydrolase